MKICCVGNTMKGMWVRYACVSVKSGQCPKKCALDSWLQYALTFCYHSSIYFLSSNSAGDQWNSMSVQKLLVYLSIYIFIHIYMQNFSFFYKMSLDVYPEILFELNNIFKVQKAKGLGHLLWHFSNLSFRCSYTKFFNWKIPSSRNCLLSPISSVAPIW